MAAFRGLSLGLVSFDGVKVPTTGLDCWASASGRLMFRFSFCKEGERESYALAKVGGRVSLTFGIAPAMEVSGTPTLRGDGGGGMSFKDCGR